MKPTIGSIVHLRLSANCAEEINRRRKDAINASGRSDGAQVHVGNPVVEGDEFPMIVTRVWPPTADGRGMVQGQVFLDGSDTLWACSVCEGAESGTWHSPERD